MPNAPARPMNQGYPWQKAGLPPSSPRMRPRSLGGMNAKIISRLAMLAWTATIAYLVFEVSRWPDSPPSHSAYGDFAPDLDAEVRGMAIGFLLFVAWPLGLTLIWGVARGWVALRQWRREAPERRRYKAERKERDRQTWTRFTSNEVSAAWRRAGDQEDIG